MRARRGVLRLLYRTGIAAVVLLVGAILAVIVRARLEDPRGAATRFAASGDRFFAEKRYQEATIQYRNAVQRLSEDGTLHHKLARAYAQAGNAAQALTEYEIAADLLPGDVELQKTAATVLLMSGRFDSARTRAEAVVARQPRDVDALLLLANALAGVPDVGAAIAQVEQVLAVAPSHSRAWLQLGILQMSARQPVEAERAYRRALHADPTSVSAHLGLGQYFWMAGDRGQAERLFHAALALGPRQGAPNRALATFYLATGQPARAEAHLKAAAEHGADARARLALADYYVLVGRIPEAERVLGELLQIPGALLDAHARLAALDDAAGRRAAALQRLDAVLAARPFDEPARLLKARLLAADGPPGRAIDELNAGLRINPASAALRFSRASLLARHGDRAAALDAFMQLADSHPRIVEVHVELARLSLAVRDPERAMRHARDALALQRGRHDARLALARALVVREDFAAARRELRLIGDAAGDLAEFHVLDALVLVAERQPAAARAAFARALARDADSLDALAGLVTLDRAEGRPAAAVARIDDRLARTPADPGARMLAARTRAQTGDDAGAEALLRGILQEDPARLDAYEQLGQLYAKTGRSDRAAAEFEQILRRQPRSVPAHTMLGILRHAQGRLDQAQRHYENALAGDGAAAVAANNLAWILADAYGDLERALPLAARAAAALPHRPEVLDTLGWIQHKRGDHASAVATFRNSLKYDPHNPQYLYHLALASAAAGDRPAARSALEKALDGRRPFDGAAGAARLLSTLQD